MVQRTDPRVSHRARARHQTYPRPAPVLIPRQNGSPAPCRLIATPARPIRRDRPGRPAVRAPGGSRTEVRVSSALFVHCHEQCFPPDAAAGVDRDCAHADNGVL